MSSRQYCWGMAFGWSLPVFQVDGYRFEWPIACWFLVLVPANYSSWFVKIKRPETGGIPRFPFKATPYTLNTLRKSPNPRSGPRLPACRGVSRGHLGPAHRGSSVPSAADGRGDAARAQRIERCAGSVLWMDTILHHFEPWLKPLLLGIYILPGLLRRCRISSIHCILTVCGGLSKLLPLTTWEVTLIMVK